MINRIISGIIALLLLFSLLALPVMAQDDKTDSDRGREAFEKLVSLGVLSKDEGYESDTEISRGDFTRVAMKLCRDVTDIYKAENVFNDVNPASTNAEYILSAYAMGFVNGDENGNFYPDRTISLTEAVKLIVCAIGYKPVAMLNGGYPSGYTKAAAEAELLRGIRFENNACVTWNDAMLIIENAVDADVCVTEISDKNTLHIEHGHTILMERYSIYKTKGIIEANAYTDLMSVDSNLTDGNVLIEGIEYEAGDTDAENYLGMSMDIYYLDTGNGDMPKLMYAAVRNNDNEVTEIDAEDIETVSKTKISYSAADKIRNLKIDGNASLIWNGKMAELTEAKLKPQYGTVTLIDNNNDSYYDVIKVMNYEPYVVSATSKITSIVSTKQGVRIELDAECDDYHTVILNNGIKQSFEDIKAGQVILYAESENKGKTVKTALVLNKTVSGKIEAIDTGEHKVRIDGKVYLTEPRIEALIKIGYNGTFYLDNRNRVVYADGINDLVYGYLIRIYEEPEGEIACRIFTENNHWVTLQLRHEIKLNNSKVSDKAAMNNLGVAPEDYRQLIRYLVNSKGQITTIETAEKTDMGSSSEKEAIQKDTFRLSAEGEQKFRTSTNSLNGVVTVANDAKIFAVPSEGDRFNTDNVMLKSLSDLEGDVSYKFKAYNVNSVRTSPILVIYDYCKASVTEMLLVKSVSGQMLGSDNDVRPALNGYWRGSELTMPVALRDDSPIRSTDALENGDIVTFSYNNKGEIDYMEKRASFNTEYGLTGGVYSLVTYITGYMRNLDLVEKKAVIEYDEFKSSAVFSLSSIQNVYIYDVKSNEFNIGTVSDLREDDRICARMRNLVCMEMFVIRSDG